nr:helix-turn-helix domain-containing protein [Nakamurella flavida]
MSVGASTGADEVSGREFVFGAYPLRAVDRVCDVLEALARTEHGATLSSVAAGAALPKSSAYRYLAALEGRGWVAREDDGLTYRLTASAAVRRIPSRAEHTDRILQAARPLLAQMRATNRLAAGLTDLDAGAVRVLWIETPPRLAAIGVLPGDRLPVFGCASGRALASQLSDPEVAELLGALPGHPATAPAHHLQDLHRVRGDGFAVGDCETTAGVRSIGVPVPGTPPMALSVTGTEQDIPAERIPTLIRMLRRASLVLSHKVAG